MKLFKNFTVKISVENFMKYTITIYAAQWLDSNSSVYLCTTNMLLWWCIYSLLGICPTTAHQFLTLFSACACVQPAAIKSPSHATGSARTAIGLFLLLVRRSGTHCLKTCEIRSVLWTVTDSYWRHFYFRSTSVFSALDFCYENALYKFTFDIDIDLEWCLYCSSSPHKDWTWQ